MEITFGKSIVSALLIIVGVATLMAPFARYVTIGWQTKRKDIMDGLNADARLAYFQMFSRSGRIPDAGEAATAFETLYSQWYGRRFFIVPGILLFLSGAIAVTFVTFTGMHRLGYMENPLFDLPNTAMAAIAGAYLWVIDDHISRARRLDFAPSEVQWGVLRLVIAIPMGYAFASVAAKSVGPFVAFALGAFPLATLITMLRRLAEKNLGLGATSEEARDDISKLQGVNRAIVERLLNEDISTVTQVAYCDPVQIVMRSNLNFVFVSDCMNQALAWMYLENDLATIRKFGMRGAVEIKCLIDSFDDNEDTAPKEKAAHDLAVSTLPKIAAAINQTPETLQLAFRQIAEDPYTIFLQRVWT